MLKENVLVFGSENISFKIPGGSYLYEQLYCLLIEAGLLPYYCSIQRRRQELCSAGETS